MNITTKTLNILKNFNTINPSIKFVPGNILRTVSPSNSILAQAKLDMEIPSQFCIHDLSQLLNTLGLFENPEIDVSETQLVISDEKTRAVYICSSERYITTLPAKNVRMPEDVACQFTLTNMDFQQTVKGMAILGLPEVAIVGDGEKLYLQGVDSEGKTKNSYKTTIGTTDKEYKIIFKPENLKLMPMDYEVQVAKIGEKIVAHFQGKTEDIQYWIAVAKNSVF